MHFYSTVYNTTVISGCPYRSFGADEQKTVTASIYNVDAPILWVPGATPSVRYWSQKCRTTVRRLPKE